VNAADKQANLSMRKNAFSLLVVIETLCAGALQITDFQELIWFSGAASSASAAITALALNAGSKKAAEWFYLSDATKSHAAKSIKIFEDRTRISLSQQKATFFCSSILYLQGAALAIQKDVQSSIASRATLIETGSVSSTVSSLLASYPKAQGYAGFCVQLLPSPTWRNAHPPCEGMDAFPNEDVVPGVALFSLKCLAASDFDWRTVSSGYRPGGASAITSAYATVIPFSSKPACSEQSNTDLVVHVVTFLIQGVFTQLMVSPISAMLTMEVKEICDGGFKDGTCLRFENIMDLFFESFIAAENIATEFHSDMMCLFFRSNFDPFAHLKQN